MSFLPIHQPPYTFLTFEGNQGLPNRSLLEKYEVPKSHSQLFWNLNAFNLEISKSSQNNRDWKESINDPSFMAPFKKLFKSSENITVNLNESLIDENIVKLCYSFLESGDVRNLTININNCQLIQQKLLVQEIKKLGKTISSIANELSFIVWDNENSKNIISTQYFLSELLSSFLLDSDEKEQESKLRKLKFYLNGSNFDLLDFTLRIKHRKGLKRNYFQMISHLEIFLNKGLDPIQLLGLSEFMELFDSGNLCELRLFFEKGSDDFLNEEKIEYFKFLNRLSHLKNLAIDFDFSIYKQKTAIDLIVSFINFKNLETFSFDQSYLDKNPLKNNVFANRMKSIGKSLKNICLNMSYSLLTSKKLKFNIRSLNSLENIENFSIILQDNKLTNLNPIMQILKKQRNLKSLIIVAKNNMIESLAIKNFLKSLVVSRCITLQELFLDFSGNCVIEGRMHSEIRAEIEKVVLNNKKLINFKMSIDIEQNPELTDQEKIEEKKWQKIEKIVNFRKILAARIGLLHEKKLNNLYRREMIAEMIEGMNSNEKF
jgi:hypothetical protein